MGNETSNPFLGNLHDKSVWAFTKQDTNFEQAVNATRLFADVLGKNINLEKYFAENHAKYGVTTDCNNNYCNQWQLYCIIMIRYYERSEIYETRKPICWHRWH